MKASSLILALGFTSALALAQDIESVHVSHISRGTEFKVKKEFRILPGEAVFTLGKLPSGEECHFRVSGNFFSFNHVQVIRENRAFKVKETFKSPDGARISGVAFTRPEEESKISVVCHRISVSIDQFRSAIKEYFDFNLENNVIDLPKEK